MESKNLGLLEAIDIALEAELKANQFYQESAQKVSSGRGRDSLEQLARFEKNHYDKLTELKDSLKEEGEFIEYEGTEFSPFKSKSEVEGNVETNTDDALKIISMAINAEKKAFEHYKRMAGETTDQQGKDMFLKLADEETLHRRILSDEFYQLSNQGGVWSWGD